MADKKHTNRRPDGTMLPGFTANTKGRPKQSRNLLTLVLKLGDEKVPVKRDKGEVMMSRKEAWVTNLWNKAVGCDPKASTILVSILRLGGHLDPLPEGANDFSESDAAVLDALIGRLSKKDDTNGE